MSASNSRRSGISPPIAPKPAARLLALALLAVLAVAAWVAAQRGFAEVIVQNPRHEIERWRSGKLAGDKAGLDAVLAALDEARAHDPRNPRMLEDAARFHAARVAGRPTSEPGVREARLRALALFREALEQRPTSGAVWASVALIKLQLGETDREFSHSLQQALHRSPWEPRVQLLAIEIGLAGWQYLAVPLREALQQAIRAQARWRLANQKPALQSLLNRYWRADLSYLLE